MVLGPKYYNINGIWALNAYYLGTWTLRVVDRVARLAVIHPKPWNSNVVEARMFFLRGVLPVYNVSEIPYNHILVRNQLVRLPHACTWLGPHMAPTI